MNAVLAAEALPEAQARAVVHKFGGSSLADADAVRQAAALVARETASPCYVVVSAAYGVTNDLLGCLHAAARNGDWQRPCARLHRRQTSLIEALVTKPDAQSLRISLREDFRRLKQLCAATAVLRTVSAEAADAAAAHGELWSMRLFAAVLQARGLHASTLDARRFLHVRKSGNGVTVDWETSADRFTSLTSSRTGGVIVVPGFVASCTDRGITLTLGRNGSDWSATILARLADAASVTIWSDVPGVLDGDPAVVSEAATQSRLGFDAARKLAAHGARVLHPATLEPLAGLDVTLHVKCTFAPEGKTTRLEEEAPPSAVMVSARGDTVSAIGDGVEAATAFAVLAHAGLYPCTGEVASGRVSVCVSSGDMTRVQRIWHRHLCRRQRRVDILLIGTGRVGRAFLQALDERGCDDSLRLIGVANSTRACLHGNGLAPQRARRALRAAQTPSDPAALGEFLRAHCEAAPVIVDATASAEIARWHARWLAAGIHVVTANKLAAAAGWITPAQRERAFYGDAATAGAGLPILAALRRLRASGDPIERIEGILSGSLAFLFDALERGRSFAAALAAARRAGLVEPDPRDDLAGIDVARKLAIIAEAAGIEAVIAAPRPAMSAESLSSVCATSACESPTVDLALRRMIREARAQDRVLCYIAELTAAGENYIGPRAVPRNSTLAQTKGVENVVVVHSRACAKYPLVVRGPGAGPEVTARALFADLALIRERYG